ncbi:MAG TPA: phage tail tape measure protein, partial [Bacteroides uniformis]|nr:phage tail tape measure protein [Bacteroides uniformis]
MAQEQNYQVNYSINVDASQGTKQVIAFGEAVGKLVQAKASLTPAVTNIKNMMDEIDRVFRTKNGKKRNFDYRLTIDTKKSEEKLERIKGLLTDISTLSKGISLTINAGQALDSKKIKANAKSLYEKKAAEMRKAEIEKNAASSVGTMADAQKRITKAIGKINSALVSMERDRELQIKTGTAENRLQQILSLLGRIKSASVISFNMQGGIPSEGLTPSVPVPYAPQAFVMPEKARQKLMERLYAGQQLHRQKLVHAEELFTADQRRKAALAETAAAEKRRADEARAKERECKNAARAAEKIRRQAEQARRKAETERIKAEQAARRQEQRNAMQSVRLMQREHTAAGTLYRSKRRAAINRIQYSKAPSLRNLPFASMLNAYMGYSLIRSELTKAIDYSNIMESAHSILRVADSDLKTFETRFDSMARHVRKIGIDTKYTAVEIAGAVKYLSMAGM